MSCEEMKQLLISWKLDQLVPIFQGAQVDKQSMLLLTEQDIRELVPAIGLRAKLRHELDTYKKNLQQGDIIIDIIEVDSFPEDAEVSDSPNTSSADTVILDSTNNNDPTYILPQIFPMEESSVNSLSASPPEPLQVSTPASAPAKKGMMVYPSPLPTLSQELRELAKQGRLFFKRGLFIKEVATLLLQLTDGNPSPRDYEIFSRTLVNTYSELKDPIVLSTDTIVKPNGTLSQRISKWIRNDRFKGKKKQNIDMARKNIYATCDNPKVSAAVASSSSGDASHVPELLAELKRCCEKITNIEHINLLLSQTENARRQIVSNAVSVEAILNEYGFLKNVELFMFDFFLMEHVTSEDVTSATYNEIISRLTEVRPMNEVDELRLFMKLEETLHPMKLKKKGRRLIILEEAGTRLSTNTAITQGPCISAYFNGPDIVEVLLLAQGQVIIHHAATNIAAKQVLLILIGAYFVLNLKYPAPYISILAFLESELLKCSKSDGCRHSVTLTKFLKTYKSK